MESPGHEQQCLFTKVVTPEAELHHNVEKLWQIDVLPYLVMRLPSCANFRSCERRLLKDPRLTEVYCTEIWKLEQNGYVARVPPEDVENSKESWYLPHHAVSHNGKDRIVVNCLFNYKGQSLNCQLLPGPTLGTSLLRGLLRFCQRPVAVSGDIKAMFHQVRLLPTDTPLLHFIWRDGVETEKPTVYECCPSAQLAVPAVPPMQCNNMCKTTRYAMNTSWSPSNRRSMWTIACLGTVTEAQDLVNKMRELLSVGGFEIRQWASNNLTVIDHLPSEARSQSSELWFSQESPNLQEPTLGLFWDCLLVTRVETWNLPCLS